MMRPFAVPFVLMLFLLVPGFSQEWENLQYPDQFKVLHRYDFRIKENNRYQGLAYREVRGVLRNQGGGEYKGQYFVLQETRKDNRLTINGVNQVWDISLDINESGSWNSPGRQPYPLFQNFPSAPPQGISKGQRWTSYGKKKIDPLNNGLFTVVPILCEFQYQGLGNYLGQEVHLVTGQYALRYTSGQDPLGDPQLERANGRHQITLYIDLQGRPLFMRDNLTDLFVYTSGKTLEHKGFHLTWYKNILPMERGALIAELERDLAPGDSLARGEEESRLEEAGVTVEEREEGILLTLNPLNFEPDRAALLPGEEDKLKTIADALKRIPDRTFHVIGHTADVGSQESQQVLSLERAKVIAQYLMNQDIDPRRILFEGRGGEQPVGSNDTEEGRRQNRRVEIFILED